MKKGQFAAKKASASAIRRSLGVKKAHSKIGKAALGAAGKKPARKK